MCLPGHVKAFFLSQRAERALNLPGDFVFHCVITSAMLGRLLYYLSMESKRQRDLK